MSGSKQTTESTGTKTGDIWAPAKPYISDIMSRAQQASMNDPKQWGGPFLANQDPTLTRSFDAITGIANRNMGSAGQPYQAAMAGIANNGLTSAMMDPLNVMAGVSSGQNRIGTEGMYGGLLGRSLNQNSMPNSVLGGLATRNPITTAGGYANVGNQAGAMGGAAGAEMLDIYGRSQGQNTDVASTLGGVMGGPGVSTSGQYQNVADQSSGPTAAQSYLTDMAKGGEGNPYLQQILDANAARVSNRVNSAMSGAGRTGSFGHGDALVRSIAEANNPLMSAAYESDQNRRLQATGQLDQARQAADATRLAAIGGRTGVEGGNIANRMTAAGQLGGLRQTDTSQQAGLLGGAFGIGNQAQNTQLSALGGQTGAQGQGANIRMGAASELAGGNRADLSGALGALGGMTGVQQQNIGNQMGAAGSQMGALQNAQAQAQNWAGMAPMLNALQYDPANRLGQIGQYNQGNAQYNLDQERAQFERQQNMPWEQLQKYTGIMGGLSPMIAPAGTTTTTGTQTTRNQQDPFQTALGAGLTGAGMFFGGGTGGLLGGLFGGGGAGMGNVGGVGGFNPYGEWGGTQISGGQTTYSPFGPSQGGGYMPGYGYYPMYR